MELLEAVRQSSRKTRKRTLISWPKVAALMGGGKPEKWESEYRRAYGDRSDNPAPSKISDPRDNPASIEMREDGTTISERKIMMSETDMKNPRFILSAHGFDPEMFELVHAVNNFWITITGDERELNNYQSKITVRPKTSKDFTLEDFRDIAQNFTYKHERIHVIRTEGKYALEIDFADLHISSMSWARESGEDNDSKITKAEIYRIVEEARELIMALKIEKLYIIFLGDILQVDTETGETTGGTRVNQDGRPNKMIESSFDIIVHIISELAIVPTEVIAVQGNHSRMVEYAIMYAMPIIFRDNPHIHFNITPRLRTCFVYGTNLIGLMHGDMPKKKWFEWLHVEYRTEWGITKRAEIHAGHLHNEMTEGQKSGQMLRFQRTPKPIDGWEYKEGFVGSEKGVMAYLWDADKGIKQTHYF